MQNPARTTTLNIVKNAKDVFIDHEAVVSAAKAWASKKIIIPVWDNKYHLVTDNDKQMMNYLFILDTLNFCFWNDRGERWYFSHRGKKTGGYFGMALALKNFFEKYPNKSNFEYLAKISFKEFADLIFQGGENLLFLKERFKALRGVALVMVRKYEGDARQFVKAAKGSFENLVKKIVKELPSYQDISIYCGKKIYFLKRAQILPLDIYAAFFGKDLGKFSDLEYPTAFADYKVPQIFRHYGILRYSDKLENKIQNRVLIKKGSREELEIRAATIWAVEYLREELEKLGKKLYSFQIDWILWNESQGKGMILPYHLTKTIFY